MTEKPSETKRQTPQGSSAKAEREARLAVALRQNLRRRKAPAAVAKPDAEADDAV
jgi:type III secretion system FlhB-like substrate exporter